MEEIFIYITGAISRAVLPGNNGSPLHYAVKSHIYATFTAWVDGGRSITPLAENRGRMLGNFAKFDAITRVIDESTPRSYLALVNDERR